MTTMSFDIISTVTAEDKQTINADAIYTLKNEDGSIKYTERVTVPIFDHPDFSYIVNGCHSRGLTIQSQHG